MEQNTIWTVGHSNHELAHFLDMLRQAEIEAVADVRRFAGSRRHPHFHRDALTQSLGDAEIEYRHLPELGGRRGAPDADSPNRAWRVAAFNAYADHMQTEEFRRGLGALEALARAKRTAIMCSEAVPWRCHRRLIADALIVRGWDVWDIFAPGRTKTHELTEFAHVAGERLTYPAPE